MLRRLTPSGLVLFLEFSSDRAGLERSYRDGGPGKENRIRRAARQSTVGSDRRAHKRTHIGHHKRSYKRPDHSHGVGPNVHHARHIKIQ